MKTTCQSCGWETPADALVCDHCGQPCAWRAAAAGRWHQRPWPWVAVGAGALALLIALGVLLHLFGISPGEPVMTTYEDVALAIGPLLW